MAATRGGSSVALRGVTFRYPARPQHATLSNFDLAVAPGETVALVGPSGAGKSTVFQLLLRFYGRRGRRGAGRRRPGRDVALHDLRERIGIVPQDSVIFSADAMENIRYGRPTASDAEVIAAAKAAFADDLHRRASGGLQDLSSASAACACRAASASASRSRARS